MPQKKPMAAGTDDEENDRVVSDIKTAAINNQVQMNSHPFEFLFLNLSQNNSENKAYFVFFSF